jgi:hypothetical protein
MRFVSNTLRIGTEKLGTGTARALEFQTDGVTRLTIAAGGTTITSTAVGLSLNSSQIFAGYADGVFTFNGSSYQAGQIVLAPGAAPSAGTRLKTNGTTLQVRVGNDSALTNIQGKLTTDTAYTAGAPTATGYLVLFDSAGTAYKVPAEAL